MQGPVTYLPQSPYEAQDTFSLQGVNLSQREMQKLGAEEMKTQEQAEEPGDNGGGFLSIG